MDWIQLNQARVQAWAQAVTVMNLPSIKKRDEFCWKTKCLSFKSTHPIVQLEANMQRKKTDLKYKFFAPAHGPFSIIAVYIFRMQERE